MSRPGRGNHHGDPSHPVHNHVAIRDLDAKGEHEVKGLLIAIGIIVTLYVSDQRFLDGKYTYAVQRMAVQMRHSFGV